MATNKYHALVCALCRREGWEQPESELRLIPGRKFQCDLVWQSARLVVEVQGGVWLPKGGHTGGKGQIDDMFKLNTLQLLGWRVLQVTPQQVQSGELQRLLADAFRQAA